MSIESANSAVECARTPATDSARNIAALIHRTTWSTRRCSRGIGRTSQHSSMARAYAGGAMTASGLAAAAGGAGRRRPRRLLRLVARLGPADPGAPGLLQPLDRKGVGEG